MQPQPPPPLSTNGVVESLMESFCQCFGTESHLSTSQRLVDDDDVVAPSTPPRHGNETCNTHSTPERKQKHPTNHLFTLQQKGKAQWNSFFFGQQTAPTTPQVASRYDSSNLSNVVTPPQPEFTSSTVTATSRRNRSKSNGSSVNAGNRNNSTNSTLMEQKSRSSSKSSSPKAPQNRKGLTKRKRTASRDDIFRCKRDQQQQYVRQQSLQFNNTHQNRSSNHNSDNMNPFLSRFLSGSSPVCMATLCFATPIRGDSSFEDNELNNNTIGDDDDDDDDAASSSNNGSGNNPSRKNNNNSNQNDVASVVSDSNTLNTAEDTITSTLYYENTKLAGLKQTNPLMPLYNSHAVGHAKDDIHQIVHLRTQQQNSDRLQQPIILTNRIPPQQYVPSIPPPQQVLQENNMDDDEDDDVEDDSGDEQKNMYNTNVHQPAKQQPPLTPTKKVPMPDGTSQHYSPIRVVTRGGNHRFVSNGATTPNQSPLPPVSKLSSDSSKS